MSRAGALFVPLLASIAVGCGNRDFGGTHYGRAQGNYFEGSQRTAIDTPNERVDTHKEGDDYVVTVRGCVLRGQKKGDGLVTFPAQRCEIDLPQVGKRSLTMKGQMSAVTKGAPLHRMLRANITLGGEDEAIAPPRRLTYMIEPAYDPDG